MNVRFLDWVFLVLILALLGLVLKLIANDIAMDNNIDRLAGILSQLWDIWGK